MKIYTLWAVVDPEDGCVPWLVEAVDEYTLDENGYPEKWEQHKQEFDCREMVIEVPDGAVPKLFAVPTVKATVSEAP